MNGFSEDDGEAEGVSVRVVFKGESEVDDRADSKSRDGNDS